MIFLGMFHVKMTPPVNAWCLSGSSGRVQEEEEEEEDSGGGGVKGGGG